MEAFLRVESRDLRESFCMFLLLLLFFVVMGNIAWLEIYKLEKITILGSITFIQLFFRVSFRCIDFTFGIDLRIIVRCLGGELGKL